MEAHPQDDPDDDSQSVEESVGNIPRKAEEGTLIDHLELTTGLILHDTKTGKKFFQIREQKGERWDDEFYRKKVNTCFTHMGKKGYKNTWEGIISEFAEKI